LHDARRRLRAALAAGGDTTLPTAPFIIYAEGYHCGQLIV
jgi:hypothetical protein